MTERKPINNIRKQLVFLIQYTGKEIKVRKTAVVSRESTKECLRRLRLVVIRWIVSMIDKIHRMTTSLRRRRGGRNTCNKWVEIQE